MTHVNEFGNYKKNMVHSTFSCQIKAQELTKFCYRVFEILVVSIYVGKEKTNQSFYLGIAKI